jgi:two-component system sensor histidine kinase UhpB
MFGSVHGVATFLLFGFVLAPLATSFLDAAVVVGTNWGRDYWMVWMTRLFSNMLAQLTIVPTIVVIGQKDSSWSEGVRLRYWIEAALLTTAVVSISVLVFHADTLLRTNVPALIYLPLPLLLWAAFRIGPAGLSVSLLAISLISIHAVMDGRGPFISSSPATSVLSMQVFLCMIGVPLLLLAAAVVEQRNTAASLREASRRLIDAQERERQRIAQELHDDIGQRLVLAKIELDQLIARESTDTAIGQLDTLRSQVGQISRATWEMSHGLYPSSLEYLGLQRGLKRLCLDISQETALECRCETHSVPDRLPANLSLCLYRVAQEALQNIVRHSQAKKVLVELLASGDRIRLRVVDDGIGFSQAVVVPGLGFSSMRDRLQSVDGGVHVDSAPGRGTRLDAWVALPSKSLGQA